MDYTSIEQSKKLLELGLSSESADMSWRLVNYGDEAGSRYEPSLMKYISLSHFRDRIFPKDSTVPCWSVGALLELIPDIEDYTILIAKQGSTYGMCITPLDSGLSLAEQEGGGAIEVVYNMVVWLLENGYINKGE